jgi:hypothetical protein
MSEQTVTLPRPQQHDSVGSSSGDCIVIVFDNTVNTYQEVIDILQKATGCSLAEAEMETWEVDKLGRSVVHHGDRAECERAAEIIATIGIEVKVETL